MASKKQQKAKAETKTDVTGTSAATGEISAKTYPPRNIKFIGRTKRDRKTGKLISDDAPIEKTAGANRYVLPKASEQREKRIFFHENAAEIASMFPHLYKLVTKKGRNK